MEALSITENYVNQMGIKNQVEIAGWIMEADPIIGLKSYKLFFDSYVRADLDNALRGDILYNLDDLR